MSSNRSNISEFIKEQYGNIQRVGIFVSRIDKSEGVGTVVNNQVSDLNDAGFDVDLFTYEQVDEAAENNVINIGSMLINNNMINKLASSINPLSWRKLSNEIDVLDLLIVHQPILCPIALYAQEMHNVETIYYNHEVTHPKDKVGIIQQIYGYTLFQIFLYISSKLRLIISVSEYSQSQYAQKFAREGLVIYNSIDEENYNKSANGTRIREKYGIKDNPLILFVGRIARSKGVHELVDIFNEVCEEVPSATLIIVGRPDNQLYYKKVQDMSKKLEQRVIFAGIVPETDLPAYYSAADLYATCSIKEGYNLTIAEAEACDTPTIAFDIGAHSEVMSNGVLVSKGNQTMFRDEMIAQLSNRE